MRDFEYLVGVLYEAGIGVRSRKLTWAEKNKAHNRPRVVTYLNILNRR